MTFTFKNDTSSCADWSARPEFLSRGDLSGVSPTIPLLYSNDFPYEALPLTSTSLISLYNNFTNFLISLNNCDSIITLYIRMTISRSFIFSINVLLIFYMRDLNGVLFLS